MPIIGGMEEDDDQPVGPDEMSTLNARATREASSTGGALSAAYVLELRRQIREDAYRTVEVADEIARRLIRSGDLWH